MIDYLITIDVQELYCINNHYKFAQLFYAIFLVYYTIHNYFIMLPHYQNFVLDMINIQEHLIKYIYQTNARNLRK